ncbi:MAG: ArsR/SmtB family transcription factor [Nitrososphaeria archaeon]
MNGIEATLRRLISSDKGGGKNVHEYAAQLKNLVEELGDDTHFRSKEQIFRALGDSTRLKIIKMLSLREMCVCEVRVAMGLTQANASYHLNILERVGLIKKIRRGK